MTTGFVKSVHAKRPNFVLQKLSCRITPRTGMIGFILILGFPCATGFSHDEIYDARTLMPFWPKSHLAHIKLDEQNLKFASLDVLRFLANSNSTCTDVLYEDMRFYTNILVNMTHHNLSSLSGSDLNLINAFNTWASDVKYSMWTLDHWNWISNDMQCKLSRFNQYEKSKYCVHEIETGEDLKNLVTGYCIPDSCTRDQASMIGQHLANAAFAYWSNMTNLTNDQSVVTLDCVESFQKIAWYTRWQTWIVILILIILTTASICASIMQRMYKTRNQSMKAFFKIFSMQSNCSKLVHTPNEAVQCMNGLKTLTMLLMILCHAYLMRQAFDTDLDATRESWRTNFMGPIMYNATYSVGTFFMLASALQIFVTLSKYPSSKNKPFSPVLWICLIINRYLRLIPLLVFSMALLTELFPYANFPLWTYIDTSRRCAGQYWRQLLFVQNLQRINLCATWTWYLAVDFQLFLINLPLVCLIQHKPKFGLIILAILIPVSCVVKAWLVLAQDYPPNLMLMVPIRGYNENFSRYSFDIYMRPQGWWNSYLMGLSVGYALHKYGKSPTDLPGLLYWPMCCVAFVFVFWTVFGIYPVANGWKNSIYDAAYAGLMSVTWASGWGWIIFICQRSNRSKYLNRFLGCKPMLFLSNLTYSCYLIHMPLVFGILYTYCTWMGGKPRIRFQHLEMIVLISIMISISYASAFVCYIFVEGPAAKMQAMFMGWIFEKLFRQTDCANSNRRPEGGELEELSHASLMRPVEKYPVRRR